MVSQSKTILILLDKRENQLKEEVNNPGDNILKKRLHKQLKEIEEARVRLKNTTYGFCESCFKSIPWRELCTMPEKRHCDNCAPA